MAASIYLNYVAKGLLEEAYSILTPTLQSAISLDRYREEWKDTLYMTKSMETKKIDDTTSEVNVTASRTSRGNDSQLLMQSQSGDEVNIRFIMKKIDGKWKVDSYRT